VELDHLFFLKKKNCSWTIPFCTVPPTKIMRGLSTFQHPVSMQLVPDCRQTPTISRENLQYASDTLLLSCVAWTVSQQMLVCTLLSCGEYLLQTEMTQKKRGKTQVLTAEIIRPQLFGVSCVSQAAAQLYSYKANGLQPPCSLGLSATSQQYFSLRTNRPPTTSQQYFSLRTNQHQQSANRTGCKFTFTSI
jgi:hypothetical protein